MDDLDFAILRELVHPQTFQWNVRLSIADVARAVQADEETVRLRVRRMEDMGIVASYQVGLNPAVLGRTLVRFDVGTTPQNKDRVEAALRAMDGAFLLFESYGGTYGLVTYQEPGAAIERQANLIGAVADRMPRIRPRNLPTATMEPTAQDWRLIQALRRDPRAPYAALAERAGASEKTVRRRLDGLTQGRAVFLNVEVDLAKAGGMIPCDLMVRHGPDSPRPAIDDALSTIPRRIFFWSEGPFSQVSFAAANLNQAEETRRRLVDVAAGRAEVEMELSLRRETLPDWLEAQIARRAGDG